MNHVHSREQRNDVWTDGHRNLVVSPPISDTIEPWLITLRARKHSHRTTATYRRNMGRLLRWLGAESTVADATITGIEAYNDSMGHLAASTIRQQLSAIRSWARWCIKRGLLEIDPTSEIDWPEKKKGLPRALKEEELTALEAILDRAAPFLDVKARRIFYRNCRVILIMLYAGLRRFEVANLIWNDIDFAVGDETLTVRNGKGGIDRTIPLHPRLVKELKRTPLKERKGAVAGQRNGRRISHKTVGHIFEQWLPEMGLSSVSAHRLRHTCATQMLKSGAGIRDIQLVLGHTDIRTTERYLDLLVEHQRSAVNRLPERFGS